MQSSQRRCDPTKAVLSVSSSSASSQAGQFGPNEWLVEEMYQRFLDDPTAVDPAWHDFFADYRPADTDRLGEDSGTDTGTSGDAGRTPTAAPAAHERTQAIGHQETGAEPGSRTAKATPGKPAASTPNGRAARNGAPRASAAAHAAAS